MSLKIQALVIVKSILIQTNILFINYSKFLIDDLYGKNDDKSKLEGVTKKNSLNDSIYSIKFFNSIVAFFVDRKNCINKKNVMNRDIEIEPSEIIKNDFINQDGHQIFIQLDLQTSFFSNYQKFFHF